MDHKKNLTAREILAIIEAGFTHSVKNLRFRDLEVEYFSSQRWEVLPEGSETSDLAMVTDDQTVFKDPEAVVQNSELKEELRLADLMTNDPLEYEKEIIDSQLFDENLE